MRWLPLIFCALLAGCMTRMGKDGRTESTVDLKYLVKTDVDRIADASRADVVDGLLTIADKLYKRNPREWQRGPSGSREAAVIRLRKRTYANWPEFGGQRERAVANLAFAPGYEGDRVAALMYGLLTMVDACYEHKEDFYILDSLSEAKLYTCARNMEVAIWKLSTDRAPSGQLFLLSNELDPNNRNLSFEREFGRIIGQLDFMAKVVADRNGRAVSRGAQAVATMVFLPI